MRLTFKETYEFFKDLSVEFFIILENIICQALIGFFFLTWFFIVLGIFAIILSLFYLLLEMVINGI